jgi:hypothetical protein
MGVESFFRVLQSPASAPALAELESECGALPRSYLAFLSESDGAESCVHDRDGDCLALWSAREVPKLNGAYQVARWLPEFLSIGSDGGDSAVGFDRAAAPDPEAWPVVRIGFGNLDRSGFVHVAVGFREWWDREFSLNPV